MPEDPNFEARLRAVEAYQSAEKRMMGRLFDVDEERPMDFETLKKLRDVLKWALGRQEAEAKQKSSLWRWVFTLSAAAFGALATAVASHYIGASH